MHRYDPARQRLALGLAGLAGLVDATGFVVAGGYFTSFMSGNTTRMGVELVHSPALALAPLALIAAFLAGVTGGAMVGRRFAGRHKRVLLGLVVLHVLLRVLAVLVGDVVVTVEVVVVVDVVVAMVVAVVVTAAIVDVATFS